MKPNVFELRAPISKVAMLGCYHDNVMVATQHCYFADMAYETTCGHISNVAMLGVSHDFK